MLYYFLILSTIPPIVWGYFLQKIKTKELRKNLQKQKNETEVWRLKVSSTKENAATIEQQKKMELLSIVATQTENAIMIMDPDGNIEWLNDGFTRMYGYTFEEFVTTRGSGRNAE